LRAAAVSRAVGDGALVVAAATPADDLGLLSAAQTSLLVVLRRAEESVAPTTTAPCGQD